MAAPTLWLPGTDHAGIATQMMVERQLAREGKSRHDMGREAFVERVWEWKAQYGGGILEQLKRLGARWTGRASTSPWTSDLSRAVREAFVRLYEEGLIYRGKYIINWCPRCRTASPIWRSVHEETQGELYEIRYPVAAAREARGGDHAAGDHAGRHRRGGASGDERYTAPARQDACCCR